MPCPGWREEEGLDEPPENIFSSPCVVAGVTWEIKETAAASQPVPSACPSNQLFKPDPLKSEVLEWRHSSHIACDTCHTRGVLKQMFWWPSMNEDMVILIIVSRFSKMPNFVLLQNLPSAKETVQLVI